MSFDISREGKRMKGYVNVMKNLIKKKNVMKTGAGDKITCRSGALFPGWMRKHRPIGCHKVLGRWTLLW